MAQDWMAKAAKHAKAARGHVGKGAMSALDRYGKVSYKAEQATEHANGKDTPQAHKQAAEAHRAAGIAAGKAGIPAYQKGHQSSALYHHARADVQRGKGVVEPSGHGALGTAHEQYAHTKTLNARNATAQAHAREGSSDKHLAASDHEKASQAHREAATAHLANNDPKTARAHDEKASYHSEKAADMRAKAGHGSPQAFSSHNPKGPTSHGNVGGFSNAPPPRGGVDHTVAKEHYQAHEKASISAARASVSAHATGTTSAHMKASAAHSKAVKTAIATGNHNAENYHTHQANEHRRLADAAAPQHGPKPLHPTNLGAKVTPQVPHAAGAMGHRGSLSPEAQAAKAHLEAHGGTHTHFDYTPHDNPGGQKGLNELKRKGLTTTVRMDAGGGDKLTEHTLKGSPAAHSVAEREKLLSHPHPLHKTGGALPTGDASGKAHTQSAKANAKPSLASHSIAAKTHMNAASTHHDLAAKADRANLPAQAAEHRASAEHHTAQAQSHRIQAQQHSQRIQKLKKLGPGQHHGTGGRFTGTPGGAK